MGARRPDPRTLPSGRAARLAVPVAVLVAILAAFAGAPGASFPAGPPAEALDKGCYCHNPDPGADVHAAIGGVPAAFESSHSYKLRVAVLGGPEPNAAPGSRQGGFILGASQGTLAPAEGDTSVVQSTETFKLELGGGEVDIVSIVTHSDAGNKQREWDVVWASPSSPEGKVFFVLVVNSVNGNTGGPANDAGDMWSRTVAASAGPGEPSATVPIHEMGVPLMAYWLGVIGFVIIIVCMVFGYFQIRQGSEHYKFPDVPQGKRVLRGGKKS
jgi:hypothetical protein